MRPRLALLSLFVLSAVHPPHVCADVVAIKAGRIVPVVTEEIADGVIVIRDGKIAEIGKNVRIPDGATVLDATGRVVMPGLVDASAVSPVRGDLNEQSEEITPSLRISKAIDPDHKALKRMVQEGVTALYVSPGRENVIGGLGAVIKPAGTTIEDMLLRQDAGLAAVLSMDAAYGNRIPRSEPARNFYYRRPTTRMAIIWMLQQAFSQAKQYSSGQAEKQGQEVLEAVLEGDIPVRLNVRRAINIRTALKMADEYGFELILDECTEGYKVADEIAQGGASAVLGPFYYYPQDYRQAREGREVNWNNAGILAKAGVQVALSSGMTSESVDLLTAARFAVRHGMPRKTAVEAVTIIPARLLGVDDRIGSIEKGKDADLLILNGEPLTLTTRVETVIIDGRTVHRADSGEKP